MLCALVGLLAGCQLTPEQELVGAWSADRKLCRVPTLSYRDAQHRLESGVYATQLKLSADHTFILTGLRQLGGTWSYSHGVLTLKPAVDPRTGSWSIASRIRHLSVSADFTQMKVSIPLPVPTIEPIVIVLDKTA